MVAAGEKAEIVNGLLPNPDLGMARVDHVAT